MSCLVLCPGKLSLLYITQATLFQGQLSGSRIHLQNPSCGFIFCAAGTAHQPNPGEGRIFFWCPVVQACLPWALLLTGGVFIMVFRGSEYLLSALCLLGNKKKMTWKEKELVVNHLSLLDV